LPTEFAEAVEFNRVLQETGPSQGAHRKSKQRKCSYPTTIDPS